MLKRKLVGREGCIAMMPINGFMAAAVLLISGCSSAFDKDAEAKSQVMKQLKDPESAQFTEVYRKGDTTCGFVNSKNGFGAYSGRQGFVAQTADVTFDDGSVSFNTLVTQKCDTSFTVEYMADDSRKTLKDAKALAAALKEADDR